MIAPETGLVFAVASAKIPMTKEVASMLGKKPGEAADVNPHRFDGSWFVSLACPPHDAAHGFFLHFNAIVKDGVFHGQYGQEGVAPWLSLDGPINPDGSALITAQGLTGDSRYNLNNIQKNIRYSYHIDATFSSMRGAGNRIENRVANFVFIKQ